MVRNLWRWPWLCLAALLLQGCWRAASREEEFHVALGLEAGFPSCAGLAGSGERALCTLRAATRAARDRADAARGAEGGAAGGDGSGAGVGADADACRFRRERGAGLHRYAGEASPDLQAVLREYAEMHAACTALERGRLREMAGRAKKRPGSLRPRCKYLVWSCTFGLGNKLMSLTSALLHAVLSQRVLLVDHPGWDALWCEPFPGSRWQVPPGFSLAEDYDSPSFPSFRARQCGGPGNSKGRRSRSRDRMCDANVVSVVFSSDMNATDHGFQVCPTEMARVRDVAFLNFRNSNQHFAAGYYLNPAVRPLLELLFPDRNVFHLLARAILHPGDQVWGSVEAFHRAYLSGAVRRIGVQVREFKGEYHAYYDQAAPLCIQAKSGLCPIEVEEALERAAAGAGDSNSSDYVSVFMASLENRHVALLRSSVAKLQEETGMRYLLFSQEGDGEQLDDIGHLKKALVDMWVLSLSDVLMTSHMSTFGYFAHGVSGLVPYHLKPWADNPCWLGASSEPCFHFGPRKVACRADGFRVDDPFKELPFLKPCPDMPRTGLQVVAGIY